MDVRLILGSLLFLTVITPAQVGAKPAEPPKAPAATTPAAQDPAKPVVVDKPAEAKPPQSPGDVITDLLREKDRLQTEIEYAKGRAKNANKMIAGKLGTRGQSFKSIDAGMSVTAPAPVVQMSKARLMAPAEFENQPKDVMFLVNGLAVRQSQYDELMQYLATSPVSGNDEIRAQRVMFDLIRTYSVAASFPENEANAQIADVYAQLESGKAMADITKTYGVVQGAKEDGSIEVTRNSFLGTKVEQVVFSLEAGKRSRPFLSPEGPMVAEVVSFEKGASPDLDKVTARMVLVGYQADPAALQKAKGAAVSGQVDIAVRDQQVMDLLPALFKPAAPQPNQPEAFGNDGQITAMIEQLKQVDEALAKLSKMDTPEAKGQLEELKKQRAKMLEAIDAVRIKKDDGAEGDKVVPDAVPLKKEQAPVKQDGK